MKKFFYVGVFLKDRVPFGIYGFTNYVDCCTEAGTMEEARQTATQYFETKLKTEVTGTRAQGVNAEYTNNFSVIKAQPQGIQQNIFENANPSETIEERILRNPSNENGSKTPLANFLKRSTFYFNSLFGKGQSFLGARILGK